MLAESKSEYCKYEYVFILCRNQQYSTDFILAMTIALQMSNFPLSYSPKISKVHIAASQQKLSYGAMLNS